MGAIKGTVLFRALFPGGTAPFSRRSGLSSGV